MLVFAIFFAGGCAGSQPKEREKDAKVERPAKTAVVPISQGVGKDALVSNIQSRTPLTVSCGLILLFTISTVCSNFPNP